jgi:uncharacterized membrane-anchored protein
MNPRVAAGVLLAVIVSLGAGWVWGASGKSAIDQERRQQHLRVDVAEARAAIFEGRVAMFLSNFGDASRRFEDARVSIEQAQKQLREVGNAERAGRLEVVLAHLKDAQRLAAQLDASAQNSADAAFQALKSIEF